MSDTASAAKSSHHNLAVRVPEDRRSSFLPDLFGQRHAFIAEHRLFSLMQALSPLDYLGGSWNFYALSDQPLYLAPAARPRYRITCEGNGYDGEVSADAAGIIATLFALSHLSFRYESDHFAESYQRLYGYAAEHAEASEIFQAID